MARTHPQLSGAAPHAAPRPVLRVLVISAHPRRDSFCAALADAYAAGAVEGGVEVRRIDLGALRFDLDVHAPSPLQQPLEPDLASSRSAIDWAEHLAVVYPNWWGVGPARLWGWLDRVLLPGFAFDERADGRLHGLLHGRTAHLLTTLDMPAFVYRWVYRAPGLNGIGRAAFGFCGIETTRTLALGAVRESDAAQRSAWLAQAHRLGRSLADGPRSAAGRARRRAGNWLRAMRLQFYPMTWLAYGTGALLGAPAGAVDAGRFAGGLAFLFLGEVATVFLNDVFDVDSDRRNAHHGPFTGGSRVLVDNRIARDTLGRAAMAALAAALALGAALLATARQGSTAPAAAVMLAFTLLGAGYTVPPLRLSWRGLGEVAVATTHGVLAVWLGHLLQGGDAGAAAPWLVGVPLSAAILPSITLSGIPDAAADAAVGKRTLAVRLGVRRVLTLAIVMVPAAPLAVLALARQPGAARLFDGLLPFALVHGAALGALLWRERRRGDAPRRIDAALVAALGYLMWFVLVPLWHLLH